MADVIFNGSSARKPVSQASVELVFDNAEGRAGGEFAQYAEISVRRVVERDRRDVTGLFLGTGLGPRSYSVIEQGMISRVIEARPEDLRAFLEEAAGISRYKERRRETENRIRHAKDNINRLNDIRTEVSKQVDSLQRQSRSAERYRELKTQERALRTELMGLRRRALDGERVLREAAIGAAQVILERQRTALGAVEAELDRQRVAQGEAADALNDRQGRFYGVGAEIARIEQAIEHARALKLRQQDEIAQAERGLAEVATHLADDETRLAGLLETLAHDAPRLDAARRATQEARQGVARAEELQGDCASRWEAFVQDSQAQGRSAEVERTRIGQIEGQIERLRQRHERLLANEAGLDETTAQAGVAACEGQLATLAERERQAREALASVEERLTVAREERLALQADRDRLARAQEERAGRQSSLEALQRHALAGNDRHLADWPELADAPRLAQRLTVAPGYERAVEAVLGAQLGAVCVDDIERLCAKEARLPPGIALIDTRAANAEATRGTTDGAALAAHVQGAVPVAGLLHGVTCVDDLANALARRSRLGAGESVVTRDGVWLGRAWLRSLDTADPRSGVVEREALLRTLYDAIATGAAALDEVTARLRALDERIVAKETAREAARVVIEKIARDRMALESERASHTARIGELARQRAALTAEAGELRAHLQGDELALGEARDRLAEALDALAGAETARQALLAERDMHRAAVAQARQILESARVAEHELDIAHRAASGARDAIVQGLGRSRELKARLEERLTGLRASVAAGEAPIEGFRVELDALLERRVAVERELNEARAEAERIAQAIRAAEQQRVQDERALESARGTLEGARFAAQETALRAATLNEQLAEALITAEEALAAITPEGDEAALATNLADTSRRIERLGPINLTAIEDFQRESERLGQLDAQLADLTSALEALEGAIHRIDRETRGRFQETFDRVNEGLKTLFPRLFGGGQARLEMTGEDLLDAGVSVIARPPGKQNSSIHLLSGGEKALTAVALVFAIFQLNPAPFCLLDEVDAPLDDHNVGRFCDLLREMSTRVQFIVITHNKLTMEMAQALVGVTMHEPGVSRLVAVDVDEAARMAAS